MKRRTCWSVGASGLAAACLLALCGTVLAAGPASSPRQGKPHTAREVTIENARLLGTGIAVDAALAAAALPEGFALPGDGATTELAVDLLRYSRATVDGRRLPAGYMAIEYLPYVVAPPEHQVDWSAGDVLILRATFSSPTLRRVFSAWNVPSQRGLLRQRVDEGSDGYEMLQMLASRGLGFRLQATADYDLDFSLGESTPRTFGVVDGQVVNYIRWDVSAFDLYFGDATLEPLWGDFVLPGGTPQPYSAFIPSYTYRFRLVPLAE